MAQFEIDEILETRGLINAKMQRSILKVLSKHFRAEIRDVYATDESMRKFKQQYGKLIPS